MGEGAQIPCLDFSREGSELADQESEAWKVLRGKVRETCESHGCFLVDYNTNKITGKIREGLFMARKPLFDLPQETKKKHNGTAQFDRCLCSPFSTLYESFGVNGSHQPQVAGASTSLTWPPLGNPSFR